MNKLNTIVATIYMVLYVLKATTDHHASLLKMGRKNGFVTHQAVCYKDRRRKYFI